MGNRERERESWLLYINCLPYALRDCLCSVSLPRAIVGWSAICDCVFFPDHTHLLLGDMGQGKTNASMDILDRSAHRLTPF